MRASFSSERLFVEDSLHLNEHDVEVCCFLNFFPKVLPPSVLTESYVFGSSSKEIWDTCVSPMRKDTAILIIFVHCLDNGYLSNFMSDTIAVSGSNFRIKKQYKTNPSADYYRKIMDDIYVYLDFKVDFINIKKNRFNASLSHKEKE